MISQQRGIWQHTSTSDETTCSRYHTRRSRTSHNNQQAPCSRQKTRRSRKTSDMHNERPQRLWRSGFGRTDRDHANSPFAS